MIQIDQAFTTYNKTVFEYFQRPGVSFYVPLYQREYCWDEDNIEQFIEDISKGIEKIIEEEAQNEIRFMGTLITVTETNKKNIQPQDPTALPETIEKIIDGQQRISTLCMFSGVLYRALINIQEKAIESAIITFTDTRKDEIVGNIKEVCEYWLNRLEDIFSVDLKRGKPTRKPKIIRGDIDKWVKEEVTNTSYISPIAEYIYGVINYSIKPKENIFPKFNKSNHVGKNLMLFERWIKNTIICNTNLDGFPTGHEIISKLDQEFIWQYTRDILTDNFSESEASEEKYFSFHLSSLIKIFTICHYLLDRCCFTIIQAAKDEWAFDMFQSLNATGTPLTAIETFKPYVVNSVEKIGGDFKTSIENSYFSKIEKSFEDNQTASQKSKFTTELLTALSISVSGYKLESHFSAQRKWLLKTYEEFASSKHDQDFIKIFGNYSEFYKDIWIDYNAKNNLSIQSIVGEKESDLSSLLILFLKESKHKMSISILSLFYNDIIENKPNAKDNFIKAVKSISAFYAIWRASKSNSGLDNVYRDYLKEKNWFNNKYSIDLTDVKLYLLKVLEKEKIKTKLNWLNKSSNHLKYSTSYSICKLFLFISSHNTIPDKSMPGLMKMGAANSAPFFNLANWHSSDFKSIEHIAPQSNESNSWDINLYNEIDELYQTLGNLTLLPLPINISASNKGWKEKYIYYKHLSEKDLTKQSLLRDKAKKESIILNDETLKVLEKSNYNTHIEHIVEIGENGNWDSKIVKERTLRILEIVWDEISKWVIN